MKTFPLWLGLRYTRANKQQRFLSLLSWLSLVGMMLGVAALIIVMSVMNGFQQELQNRILHVMPELSLEVDPKQSSAAAFSLPDVHQQLDNVLSQQLAHSAVTRALVGGDALIQHQDKSSAVQLKGVEPNRQQQLLIQQGEWLNPNTAGFDIVLGYALADRLHVAPGDTVQLVLPSFQITPFGIKPRSRQFRVIGLFNSGSAFDNQAAFIDIQQARKLYRLAADQVHALEIFVDSRERDKNLSLVADFSQRFADSGLQLVAWQQKQQQLYRAIKMEQFMIAFMLSLVIAVAAFNLIALLTMMVASKRSDIAVLQMMGMRPHQAMQIFLTQGLSLTMISLFVGCLIGVLIATNISAIVSVVEQALGVYIFDPKVFYITGLPSDLQLVDVLYVIGFTILLSIVFSSYPAWRASQIQPVEALAYR